MTTAETAPQIQVPPYLEPHLQPGEVVVWSARPERSLFLRQYRAISAFGMAMVGIMGFWFFVSIVLAGGVEPIVHNLVFFWAVPSVVVALLLIYGPLVVAAREWGHTEYVLTNRRLVLRRGVLSPKLSVISLNDLPRVEVQSKKGWGHVLLLGGTALERLDDHGRMEYHPSHLTLRDLPGPDQVRERILAARAALA